MRRSAAVTLARLEEPRLRESRLREGTEPLSEAASFAPAGLIAPPALRNARLLPPGHTKGSLRPVASLSRHGVKVARLTRDPTESSPLARCRLGRHLPQLPRRRVRKAWMGRMKLA